MLGSFGESAAGSVRAAVSALPLKRSRTSCKSGGSCLGTDLRMLAEPRESCDVEQLAGVPSGTEVLAPIQVRSTSPHLLISTFSRYLGGTNMYSASQPFAPAVGSAQQIPADQDSQFTSDDFIGTLQQHGVIIISMDGKGCCMDNIFVERLWRSLKCDEVYLHACATVTEAKAGIGARLNFYNQERQR